VSALAGVRVLDLTRFLAGPFCTAILADLGAEVIKVEAPRGGDEGRYGYPTADGVPVAFLALNRNKKGITLDLRHPEGRALVRRFLPHVDVLAENFAGGTLARWGLAPEQLVREHPRLIVASMSGFGQTGPYSRFGGYDAIIQALSGLMSVTGEAKGPPLRVGVPITDILAALYAAFSVTLALLARQRTKSGQLIDVSLFESGVSAVSQWITISNLTGTPVRRFGNSYPLLAPYELFETKDRPIVVAVGNDELWAKLCRIIEREDLIADPRFQSNPDRILPANREILTGILQEAWPGRPRCKFNEIGCPSLRDTGESRSRNAMRPITAKNTNKKP